MKPTPLSFQILLDNWFKIQINVRKVSITTLPIKMNLSSKGNAYFLNEAVFVLIKNKPQTAVINILNLFTAVCVLFFIKLRWPKNKSIYDTVFFLYGCSLALNESYIQFVLIVVIHQLFHYASSSIFICSTRPPALESNLSFKLQP